MSQRLLDLYKAQRDEKQELINKLESDLKTHKIALRELEAKIMSLQIKMTPKQKMLADDLPGSY